jgi:hypothetical protein
VTAGRHIATASDLAMLFLRAAAAFFGAHICDGKDMYVPNDV